MPAIHKGPTGIVLPIDAANPIVGRWRALYDSSAAERIPPHVTVLYPFMPAADITPAVAEKLIGIFAEQPAMRLTFAECGRFPDALYMRPTPTDQIIALTDRIADTWPQWPPYGGAFEEVIPHLTIAISDDRALLDEIEADVTPMLPLTVDIDAAQLYLPGAGVWHPHLRLELATRSA